MKLQRIVYIVSGIDKALHFEWIVPMLRKHYHLSFILLGPSGSALGKFLHASDIKVYSVVIGTKVSFINAWVNLAIILWKERPNIVHCHLLTANILGLSAAWVLRVPKRIFTRHHAMVHYDDHPSGRKWDLLCNWMATDVIAISKSIYQILIDKDKASPSKLHLIPHGFDLSYFQRTNESEIDGLRQKYKLNPRKPIVGVIARYTSWKGIQYIIPAFRNLLNKFPMAHLILANAHGEYKGVIQEMLRTLPPESYTEIRYEYELGALYKLFDVYIHVPVDTNSEAFGQTYVEALASGVPSIFSLSGISNEFIIDRVNALVVRHRDADEISVKLHEILTDQLLAKSLVKGGYASVQAFALENMIAKLERVYG